MCGITGIFSSSLRLKSGHIETEVRTMLAALAHRGPDDEGIWCDTDLPLALGHRRLAILDLSPTGHQPMVSASGRFVTVFNGEVYNFKELSRELLERGHSFRGTSDTEVILAAFEEWGILEAVKRFNGMFAIAVWDVREHALSLIRDRLGVKPLYYGWNRDSFLFASELKALKRSSGCSLVVEREALSLFMRSNYIPAPWSIYEGIYKLLPGTIITIPESALHAKPAEFSQFADSAAKTCPTTFWSLAGVAKLGIAARNTPKPDEDYLEELHGLLRDSIRLRMIADVPLGAFLSGGIDSSLVVSLMQHQSTRPVKTFTIGVYDQKHDESQFARDVAKHLGTEHTELFVTPEIALQTIPKLPTLFDEPFSDSSQIPTFLVSQLTKAHVTVSLSGDGGDEFFAGYEQRYRYAADLWRRLSWLPANMRWALGNTLSLASESTWDALALRAKALVPERLLPSLIGRKIHKFSRLLANLSPDNLYSEMLAQWDPSEIVIRGHTPPCLLTSPNLCPILDTFLDRMMFIDQSLYLPDDIMVKVDRASMGVSLEAREPLLDYRIIEASWKLPLHLKSDSKSSKIALRRILSMYLPTSLFERPKRGFSIPIDSWLRGPLREWAAELLNFQEIQSQGFLQPEAIRTKWQQHLAGTHSWHYLLWNVLMFQAWLRENG